MCTVSVIVKLQLHIAVSESWQNQGHSRHHVREGAHIDRTDHVVNSSVSTLVSHRFHEECPMEHSDMKINQVVVMYLNDDRVSRPTTRSIVSPCKDMMSCFSCLFLGVPRHYARRSYNCWWKTCWIVRRPICCNNIIRDSGSWQEGCWDCDEGAAKDQVWQVGIRRSSRALSPKGETHMYPEHNWLMKFGKVTGSMSCVEKEFKLALHKYEEYKGRCSY